MTLAQRKTARILLGEDIQLIGDQTAGVPGLRGLAKRGHLERIDLISRKWAPEKKPGKETAMRRVPQGRSSSRVGRPEKMNVS